MINILSAYSVMNEAEQCPSKPILKMILALSFVILLHVSEIIVNFHIYCQVAN